MIFLIGNSKVVVVLSFLALLSLLSPMMNSSNPYCSRHSLSCVGNGPIDIINGSDTNGVGFFTTLPVSGY